MVLWMRTDIRCLKQQRQVDVIVPLRSNMIAFDDAVRLAAMAGKRHPHPSRATRQIAFVPGVEHVWATCRVPLNACVIRYWHAKKHRHDHIVLVTTDQELTAKWIVKHYEQRPEIEQDYEQMKSGGWKLQRLSSTRYSQIVFYLVKRATELQSVSSLFQYPCRITLCQQNAPSDCA